MNARSLLCTVFFSLTGMSLEAGSKAIPGTQCKSVQDCHKHAGVCYSKEYGSGHLYDSVACNKNGQCECRG